MKKRNLLRVISLLLMFGMLFSTASAASQVQPRYAKIHTLTSELLDINWLGKATCCGTVTVLDESCRVDLYLEIQRIGEGDSYWSTVKSWNTTGSWEVVIEKNYYVASGYNYRVVTTAIVYDSNGNFIESNAVSSAVLYH